MSSEKIRDFILIYDLEVHISTQNNIIPATPETPEMTLEEKY